MSIDSRLFADPDSMEARAFGTRRRGRYKMPLLPGEVGTKSGGDWVPFGLQSVTNLLDGFEESRALNLWEQMMLMVGMVRQPSLFEKLCLIVHQAEAAGVDFLNLPEGSAERRQLVGDRDDYDMSILGQAKQAAGANEAREAGTNRHISWEHRAKTGELIGTPDMQEQIVAVEALLATHGLERVPGLCERTIRHTGLRVAGRFDDILLEQSTGRLLMSDLKTKRKRFKSMSAVDGQLATYAGAEWMLTEDSQRYEPGPLHIVDQTEGVVLQMPSNGDAPYLRRADFEHGRAVAEQARKVVDLRAYGKSAERMRLAEWPAKNLPEVVDNTTAHG